MAGDWIKFEKATLDKPEVFEISGILGIDPDAVIGKLMRVWNWFDDQSRDGYAPVTLRAQLNRITGVTGFVEAMQRVGWMVCEEDRISIPNFDRHNGQTSKQRALSAKRMAKRRGKSYDDSVTPSVTKAQPEKIREEKSNTPPNPHGGLFGDGFEKPDKPASKLSDNEKKNTRVRANTPTMDRIGAIMNRKPGTLWTVAEMESLGRCQPSDAEIEGMKAYYDAEEPHGEKFYRRKNLQTLLNNWPSELDAARKWIQKQ